jgi:acetyltransferase-like isoleucine patch superfamily enzyme
MFKKIPGKLFLSIRGVLNRCLCFLLKPLFITCGANVKFDAFGFYTFAHISIGSDVYIGPGAKFSSSGAILEIGSKVLFGPNVTIMTGDHNILEIGAYIFDVRRKKPSDDLPVKIQDDVWIGSSATILKGVIIERGAVVAAGAVVTKNVPPYSIVAGVPARVIKYRWTIEEILRHEDLMYPVDQRIQKNELMNLIN